MSPPPPNHAFYIYDYLPDYWLRLATTIKDYCCIARNYTSNFNSSMQANFKYCNRGREAEAVPATEYPIYEFQDSSYQQ